MRGWSRSFGAEKNDLRQVRVTAIRVVGSQDPTRSRSWDRRSADIPEVRGAACQVPWRVKMKSERLEFLADNPFYTRFGLYVGRRRRSTSIRDFAVDLKLDWHTVKELGKQYMRAQLAKAETRDRHRRNLGPQRPRLSDRGQRSCSQVRHLVRRRRSVGSQHVQIL
jgi:hypothetical protein